MPSLWLLSLAVLVHLAPERCPRPLCSCVGQPSVRAAHADADAVFLGTVLSVRDTTLSEDGLTYSARAATLRLVRPYKGRLPARFTVLTGHGGGDCGFDFQPGVRYLVYAEGGSGGLTTGICSRTRTAAEAREDLAALARRAPR